MKNKTKLLLLGLLLAGLLLLGIGAGVMLLEAAEFTYGGTALPAENPEVLTETFTLQEGTEQFRLQAWMPQEELGSFGELLHCTVSEEIAPGTVQITTTYHAMGNYRVHYQMGMNDESTQYVALTRSGSAMSALLTVKDRLLEDLQQRALRDYLPVVVERVDVRLNPADQERICAEGTNLQGL